MQPHCDAGEGLDDVSGRPALFFRTKPFAFLAGKRERGLPPAATPTVRRAYPWRGHPALAPSVRRTVDARAGPLRHEPATSSTTLGQATWGGTLRTPCLRGESGHSPPRRCLSWLCRGTAVFLRHVYRVRRADMTGAKAEAMKTGIVLALPAGTTVNVSWHGEVACCPMATRATGDRAFGSLYRGNFMWR